MTAGAFTVTPNGGAAIGANVGYSGLVVTLTPSAALSFGTTYQASLANSIRDKAGNPLGSTFSWTFATQAAPVPFDFDLVARFPTITTIRGGSASSILEVTVVSGTPQPVTFAVEGCPAASTCTVSPNSAFNVANDAKTFVTLHAAFSPLASTGTYPITVKGTSGSVEKSQSVSVTVGSVPPVGTPRNLWGSETAPVSVASGQQMAPVGVADGGGGAIFAMFDRRWTTPGLMEPRAQRSSPNGLMSWSTEALPLAPNFGKLFLNMTGISDGSGGAIYAWENALDGHQVDLYAQRIGPDGSLLWSGGGAPISTSCYPNSICAKDKLSPQIISDGAGGTIATWYEPHEWIGFATFTVWAQRLDANGVRLWPADGMPVIMEMFHTTSPRIVSDGHGGAIIAWYDQGSPTSVGIYAQRLNENGLPQWAPGGVPVAVATGQSGLGGFSMISDGSDGAIIAWVDRRTGDPNNSNIYVQKINSQGQPQWEAGGVPVCTRSMEQYSPVITSDGSGGAIIAWEDTGASPQGSGQQWILAQHVSAQGDPLWTLDGIPIYTVHGASPMIVSDQDGGAIIVWSGIETTAGSLAVGQVIRSQRVSGAGQQLWQSNGFAVHSYVSPSANYGYRPEVVSDGAGGAVVSWQEYRLSGALEWDIFAQRISDLLP